MCWEISLLVILIAHHNVLVLESSNGDKKAPTTSWTLSNMTKLPGNGQGGNGDNKELTPFPNLFRIPICSTSTQNEYHKSVCTHRP